MTIEPGDRVLVNIKGGELREMIVRSISPDRKFVSVIAGDYVDSPYYQWVWASAIMTKL